MSGVENDIFARPPNLTMAFYDLDLWSSDPKFDHFMPSPHGPLVPICVRIDSFSNMMFASLAADKWEKHYENIKQKENSVNLLGMPKSTPEESY